MPRRAFVGLGSSVDPARHLRLALAEVGRAFSGLERSPVCVSPAFGYEGPEYWNLCASFTTSLDAGALRAWLKDLERRLGRQPREPRYAPKTLDADLLLLGDETSDFPPLPHPEILARAYVLGPLAMLDPKRRLPGNPVPVGTIWKTFPGASALQVLHPDPL